jgi:hypothetical protein
MAASTIVGWYNLATDKRYRRTKVGRLTASQNRLCIYGIALQLFDIGLHVAGSIGRPPDPADHQGQSLAKPRNCCC